MKKFLLIIGIILLCFYFLVRENKLGPINLGKEVKVVYPLGKFTVTIPSDSVNLESETYSGLLRKYYIDDECAQVSGVYSVVLERVPPLPIPDYQMKPFISIESWNTDELVFRTSDENTNLHNAIESLKKLDEYSDTQVLQKKILSQSYIATTDNPSDPNSQPNINIWNGLTSCSMIYSVPIYIQRVENTNYNNVFYAEVLEGNGDTYGSPVRALIVEKENNWLLIKEGPALYTDASTCAAGELTPDALSCVESNWSKIYRDNAANTAWIKNTLDYITYK